MLMWDGQQRVGCLRLSLPLKTELKSIERRRSQMTSLQLKVFADDQATTAHFEAVDAALTVCWRDGSGQLLLTRFA